MVVQVFASMHRDQMGLLQKEMDQIHRITRELNELQAEVRNGQQRGAPTTRNGAPVRPALMRPTPANPGRPAVPQPVSNSAGARPVSNSTSSASVPAASAAGPPPPVPANGAMPDLGDMHDWVNQRILTLQKEREGRWQKILGFVLGK
jgi:hypothetical protein